MEPTSSPPPNSYKQFNTPTKARVQGTIEFAKHKVFCAQNEKFSNLMRWDIHEAMKSSSQTQLSGDIIPVDLMLEAQNLHCPKKMLIAWMRFYRHGDFMLGLWHGHNLLHLQNHL